MYIGTGVMRWRRQVSLVEIDSPEESLHVHVQLCILMVIEEKMEKEEEDKKKDGDEDKKTS